MMFYNKKLFDQAGISYPSGDWTWEDFLAIAQKLTRDLDGDGATDQFGAAFSNYFYFWIAWVWSAEAMSLTPGESKRPEH